MFKFINILSTAIIKDIFNTPLRCGKAWQLSSVNIFCVLKGAALTTIYLKKILASMLDRVKVNVYILWIQAQLYSQDSILMICNPSKDKQLFVCLNWRLNCKKLRLFSMLENIQSSRNVVLRHLNCENYLIDLIKLSTQLLDYLEVFSLSQGLFWTIGMNLRFSLNEKICDKGPFFLKNLHLQIITSEMNLLSLQIILRIFYHYPSCVIIFSLFYLKNFKDNIVDSIFRTWITVNIEGSIFSFLPFVILIESKLVYFLLVELMFYC